MLARDKAGTLWRYDGTGTGRWKARVRVFSNWGGSYNAIVGVGDITGDGRNDLVMRDTAGNLYRQTGSGKGAFASRVKIATGWQGYRASSDFGLQALFGQDVTHVMPPARESLGA